LLIFLVLCGFFLCFCALFIHCACRVKCICISQIKIYPEKHVINFEKILFSLLLFLSAHDNNFALKIIVTYLHYEQRTSWVAANKR